MVTGIGTEKRSEAGPGSWDDNGACEENLQETSTWEEDSNGTDEQTGGPLGLRMWYISLYRAILVEMCLYFLMWVGCRII